MSCGRFAVVCCIVTCLALGALTTEALGQAVGPEAYAMASVFGMSSTTPTRQLGMGAPSSCVSDIQCVNPAFAADTQTPDAGLRFVTTDFERGPRITSYLVHGAYPLRPGESGLQLTWLTLDSSGGNIMLPGVGPATAGMSEHGLVVVYGHRLNDQLCGGMSVLGSQRSSFDFTPPLGPALANIRGKASWGLRGGLTYEWAPGDYLGVVYGYSQNDVTANGLMFPTPFAGTFHSDQIAVGASGHVTPELLAVIEYREGSTSSGQIESSTASWQFGAEYQAAPEWAVRAGLTDQNPTFGVGYEGPTWRVDYAFISDWHDDSAGRLFGGSETHSLQVIGSW
ncbi:MAG TPA: hypothetical protein VM283_07815 [Armatimonadota bacterium]|nr:hypothetical protein [Armatimonadota bacterium]